MVVIIPTLSTIILDRLITNINFQDISQHESKLRKIDAYHVGYLAAIEDVERLFNKLCEDQSNLKRIAKLDLSRQITDIKVKELQKFKKQQTKHDDRSNS